MRARVLLVGCLVVAGCGATSKSGGVGETLSSRTLRVTLEKYVPRVPAARGHDVTGFDSPGAGNRFVGVRMKVCRTKEDQAINAFAFKLVAGGAHVNPSFPQSVYSPDFGVSRSGCVDGWILYAVPRSATASKLEFRYDDTGGGQYDTREEHARFSWTLG
ncbi:MAG: hypothetical protein QOF76_4561 [Solirubrobacteraceae bacterium]|nr:hypothetical protein [Solirubrobacteraceae bacterium]